MRRLFRVATIGLLLAPSFAQAGEKHAYADTPHGYTQEEMMAFKNEGRMPVTPRMRGIFETRFDGVSPYLLKATFCRGADFYTATFSFEGTADQIAGAIARDRLGFYRNLDRHAGRLDRYLREQFRSGHAQSPQALRRFLDGMGTTIGGSGFTPAVSGSVKSLTGGCLTS